MRIYQEYFSYSGTEEPPLNFINSNFGEATSVGIQAPVGAKFKINNTMDLIIGPTQCYEISNIINVSSITLQAQENNRYIIGKYIIDSIYPDKVSSDFNNNLTISNNNINDNKRVSCKIEEEAGDK